MQLEIALSAKADLRNILAFGEMTFGTHQASAYLHEMIDLFYLMAETPEMNRVRHEFGEGVRVQPFQAHVIFYRIKKKIVVIERVLSRYQNWTSEKI